jgi:hypothetical protein
VRVNLLRGAEDGKQGSVSRDEKQTGGKNQAKWRREWKKGGQVRVVEKKASMGFTCVGSQCMPAPYTSSLPDGCVGTFPTPQPLQNH